MMLGCPMAVDFNEKELLILNYLGQNKDAKMSELAEIMSAPFSTLTSVVDKLVEKKILCRYHSSEDRRVVLVCLDKNGKEIYDNFLQHKNKIAKTILNHFDEKDREQLIGYMERVPNALIEKV